MPTRGSRCISGVPPAGVAEHEQLLVGQLEPRVARAGGVVDAREQRQAAPLDRLRRARLTVSAYVSLAALDDHTAHSARARPSRAAAGALVLYASTARAIDLVERRDEGAHRLEPTQREHDRAPAAAAAGAGGALARALAVRAPGAAASCAATCARSTPATTGRCWPATPTTPCCASTRARTAGRASTAASRRSSASCATSSAPGCRARSSSCSSAGRRGG